MTKEPPKKKKVGEEEMVEFNKTLKEVSILWLTS